MIESPRGKQLLEAARINFTLIREHGEKVSQSEADFIIEQIVASIRSYKPLALSLPTPEKP